MTDQMQVIRQTLSAHWSAHKMNELVARVTKRGVKRTIEVAQNVMGEYFLGVPPRKVGLKVLLSIPRIVVIALFISCMCAAPAISRYIPSGWR